MKKLAICLLAAIALSGQPEKKKLAFDVVSIKPNKSGDLSGTMMVPPTGRLTTQNASLRQLIIVAYDPYPGPLSDPEIAGLPGWAKSDGYDVQAQAEAGFIPTKEQMREMLQSMLEDRFKLKIRRQLKDGPIYALVVDKGGLKMKLSEDQTPPTPPGSPASLAGFRLSFGRISTNAQTTASLAIALAGPAGRKVVDKTGLAGLYGMDLTWTPDQGVSEPGTGPSLFTALPEQLGLRLVSETGKVDTFVVESVERPSEN